MFLTVPPSIKLSQFEIHQHKVSVIWVCSAYSDFGSVLAQLRPRPLCPSFPFGLLRTDDNMSWAIVLCSKLNVKTWENRLEVCLAHRMCLLLHYWWCSHGGKRWGVGVSLVKCHPRLNGTGGDRAGTSSWNWGRDMQWGWQSRVV